MSDLCVESIPYYKDGQPDSNIPIPPQLHYWGGEGGRGIIIITVEISSLLRRSLEKLVMKLLGVQTQFNG